MKKKKEKTARKDARDIKRALFLWTKLYFRQTIMLLCQTGNFCHDATHYDYDGRVERSWERRDEIKVVKFNGNRIQSALVCDQTNSFSPFVQTSFVYYVISWFSFSLSLSLSSKRFQLSSSTDPKERVWKKKKKLLFAIWILFESFPYVHSRSLVKILAYCAMGRSPSLLPLPIPLFSFPRVIHRTIHTGLRMCRKGAATR